MRTLHPRNDRQPVRRWLRGRAAARAVGLQDCGTALPARIDGHYWAQRADAFERCVAAREPFGLVVDASHQSIPNDVYAWTGRLFLSHPIYRGVHGGRYVFACVAAVHGRVWAVSESSDETSWSDCAGEQWIDMETGSAHSAFPFHESSRVPFRFEFGLVACTAHLPFEAIDPAAATKAFESPLSPGQAECWLAVFFGPHASWQGAPAVRIEVPDVVMLTDLVIRSGVNVALHAASSVNARIVLGEHQIRVEAGGRLEMVGLTIADSVASSALVVHGTVKATRCAFVRCTAAMTMIFSGFFDALVPDGVRASTVAAGGAIFVAHSGLMELTDSAVLNCTVTGGNAGGAAGPVEAVGGGIFVFSTGELTVVRSEFWHNMCLGGLLGGFGGALHLHLEANAGIRDSAFRENAARGGDRVSGAGALFLMVNSRMTVERTEVCDNVVSTGGDSTSGGAFFLYSGAQLLLSSSLVCRNVAEAKGTSTASGGAGFVYTGAANLTAVDSQFLENVARGGLYAFGGVLRLMSDSDATFVRTTLARNSAFGSMAEAMGGALKLDKVSRVRIEDSEVRQNSVSGTYPSGGGIYSEADTLELLNVTLSFNRATVVHGLGFGGALYVKGPGARLTNCRLLNNVAESLQGSYAALGGGVFADNAVSLLLAGSVLRLNTAGGIGSAQPTASAKAGRHITFSGGTILLDRCDADDDAAEGADRAASLKTQPAAWFAADSRLVLHNSTFRSADSGQLLVKVASAQLEVVVRGCSVTNLPIESFDGSRPLGIVNSTFEPPPAGSLKTVQAPSCGAVVAGERVCDERARCDSFATGGVVCACVGAGLRYKAGVPKDGRRCEQDAKLSSVLESESVFVAVTKPGVQTGHLRLVTRAVAASGQLDDRPEWECIQILGDQAVRVSSPPGLRRRE